MTADTHTCPQGGAVTGRARFCPDCGARLENGQTPTDPDVGAAGRSASAGGAWRRRLRGVSPEANEFASAVAAQARAPGVVVATATALAAGAVLWLAGLLMSFLSQRSILGSVPGVSHVKFAFFRTAEMTLALDTIPSLGVHLRVVPGTLALLTLAAVAIPAALLSSRTRALSDRQRLLWGAAAAIPFAILMLLCAVIAGTVGSSVQSGGVIKVSASGSFLLGLAWGALGGGLGAGWAIRRERGKVDLGAMPGWAARCRRLLGGALGPLLAALVLCALLGTLVWMVQSIRNAGDQRAVGNPPARSTAIALFDDATFALDNGVHLFELSSGVSFHQPGEFGANGMPLPATKVSAIAGAFVADTTAGYASVLSPPGTFRIFDYGNGLPTVEFIALLLTIIVPILAAAFGGFSLARVADARTSAVGAAWGALLGPIWCVTMVVVNALVQKQLGGKASGNDVLVIYLLAGAAIGAAGGLLAASRHPDRPAG
ncbi:MAG: hypothetical protein ABSG43_24975 [Solirubrobacteraceae bacterium]